MYKNYLKKTYIFIFLIILFEIITLCSSQFGSEERFSPCTTDIFSGERILNGPPGKRNTWNGIIYLHKYIEQNTNVDIVLLLESAGKLKIKDKSAQVSAVNGGYKISYQNAPSSVEFSVSANPNSRFPNPIGVYLNGKDVCRTSSSINHNNNENIFSTTDKPYTIRPTDFGEKFNNETYSNVCGKRQIKHEGLITNGYASKEGDWPWHAGLFKRKDSTSINYSCGGTLIATDTVLTAAHCVIESTHFIVPNRLIVKLGQYNRLLDSRNTEEFQVFSVIPHEEFDFTTYKHDIAILKLSTGVIFNYYIQPICLWPKQQINLENVLNRNGVVIGWGLNEQNELSDVLTQGNMPVVDFSTCLESNRDFFGNFLSNYNFCAGYRNGTSVCNGDSGGGMVFEINGIYHLRGIVSLAVAKENENRCNPKQFVLFTDVAKYLDWIQKHS